MLATNLIAIFFACVGAVLASPVNETQPRASCTVTSYSKVADALTSCSDIILDGITVPASTTLDLTLNDGAKVTFKGYIKFDYATWDGPLIHVKGKGITVQGASGHSLDGQGGKYWDGKGDSGKTKPKFFKIQATGSSVFKNINLLNCPRQCVSIGNSDGVTLSGWDIDVSAGDSNGGHNTDGFDISSSNNVVIENSVVQNQDDCVAINYGSNMKFTGLTCSGGHGLSLSVGQSKTDASSNVVSNIVFSDCTVKNSRNGIHIKTHTDAAGGSIKDVTYSNINLSGITYYGINVQEDYKNGGSTGEAKGNIPITGLKLSNIKGSMTGSNSMPVYILCGDGGCSSWSWSGISITGNKKSNSCNYTPSGFSC